MKPSVSRRAFMAGCAAVGAALPVSGCLHAAAQKERNGRDACGTFALDESRVRFFCPLVREPLRVLVLGDTHLHLDDARGEPFKGYSGRMAKAYDRTRHYKNGAETNPQACFEASLTLAKERQSDLVVLVGDLFSFPSEAAVEWALGKLKGSGLPYLYVSGNHDWHYEGMEGTGAALRAEWAEKRLGPLYQGRSALMQAVDVKGVCFVAIDNSTYEILPEQLAFFRRQVKRERPLVLCMHVPLYAPGRDLGFGCGHPQWGASSDRNWKIERRPQWPASGHTEVTMAFHREVFSASHLLGVFAGHTHQQSLDVVNGVPQFVTPANATGGSLVVDVVESDGR